MAHSFLKDPGSNVGVAWKLGFQGVSRGHWNSEPGTEAQAIAPGCNIELFPGAPGIDRAGEPGQQNSTGKVSWLLRLLTLHRFPRPLGKGCTQQPSPAADLCPSSSTAAGLVSKPAGPLLSGAAVVAPFAPRLLGVSPCQMFLGSPAAAA